MFLVPVLFSLISYAQTYEISLLGVASTASSGEIFAHYTPIVNYLSRRVYNGLVKGGIKLRVYKSQTELMNAVISGRIHIARIKPQTFFRLKQKMPEIILGAGELIQGSFFREGILIVQRNSSIKGFGEFREQAFAFGGKTDPLLDIAAKSMLRQKGLWIQDIRPVYIADTKKREEYVEIGRVRAGVTDAGESAREGFQSTFRVVAEFRAPNMIWIISRGVFLSTREKLVEAMVQLDEEPILNTLGVSGFRTIRESDLAEFKADLANAITFHQKRK
jgi:ABC-type phosphate/phosphonate transport system substrate-binding protein